MPKLITLAAWAELTYGDDKPCPNTLRAWARKSLIWPTPVKHGRSYYVQPDAAYTRPDDVARITRPSLLERITSRPNASRRSG